MRVLGQEVVLGGPGVLDPRRVGGGDEGHLVHDAVVLGRGPVLLAVAGKDADGVEDPELHGGGALLWRGHDGGPPVGRR